MATLYVLKTSHYFAPFLNKCDQSKSFTYLGTEGIIFFYWRVKTKYTNSRIFCNDHIFFLYASSKCLQGGGCKLAITPYCHHLKFMGIIKRLGSNSQIIYEMSAHECLPFSLYFPPFISFDKYLSPGWGSAHPKPHRLALSLTQTAQPSLLGL